MLPDKTVDHRGISDVRDCRNASRGPARGIECVRGVRKVDEVLGVVIPAQIVAQTPDDDRRMVKVPVDHLAQLLLELFEERPRKALGVDRLGTVCLREDTCGS